MRTCSIEECENKHWAKEYCRMHYTRWCRYGDPLVTKNHGKRKTPEYSSWANMKNRCTNANDPHYKNWGGRGITVCERWENSFMAFFEDMGEKPFPKAQIDRIDNDGNYELSNCRWTTAKINSRNSRRAKLTMELAEKIRKEYVPYIVSLSILARKYNVDRSIIHDIVNNKYWT